MVRAILEGRKTQTRRVIDPQPNFFVGGGQMSRAEAQRLLLRWTRGLPYKPTKKPTATNGQVWEEEDGSRFEPIKCRFGLPGDHLWVRETWRPKTHAFPTGHQYEYRATAETDLTPTDGTWKPSIFMPRDASRITLEVIDIRVERLQDISPQDAVDEGISYWRMNGGTNCYYDDYESDLRPGFLNDPVASFRSLWKHINGSASWEANPWVWVVNFKKI